MPEPIPKFAHLHVHSHYSMLDGMGKIPNIIKKIKADGQTAMALTDHGVMYGAIEFYEACEKEGIKPIIGVEAYVSPRKLSDKQPGIDAKAFHLILLAKNEAGYKNLLQLTSIAHLDGYYYKPRIDKETLKAHSEGIIACSACIQGEIPRAALESIENGRNKIKEYLDIFAPEDLYLEVQCHDTLPDQARANELIYKLADEFGLKVVATNDAHYIDKDDNIAQDALLCLQTGKVISDENRMSMMGENLSLLTREEMAANFKDHPEVLANTLEIADKCNIKIELGKFRFPEFPLPENETYETYLKKLIDERLPKRVAKITPEIQERIDYEFKVIKDKGYLGYFLIVQDFFQWAKENGIPTNTRGSAAGCFISYALGITAKQLNPMDYNLPFERFLNPFRPSAPDIDADIADSGRDAIIQYVSQKYGQDHVAQIITFGTMAARMAVRDVGRVLGMSYSEVDIIAKLIPAMKTTLQQALDTIAELKSLYNSDAKVKQCIDIAQKLEGVVRHASVHAAGVVIAPEKITNFTPVMMDAKGERLITQYEMHSVGEDGIGLIKMDFLGLANLAIIQNVIKIVKKTRDIDINLDEIPLDDKKAFDLLSRGETIGVFQLESEGMRKYIKELRPTTIDDIMAMVALYRPGPMSFIPEYISRKHNPARVKYLDPRMKKFLAKSLGLIVYQDDVLMIAIELAGYNWQEVDKFRKAIGKKIVTEMAAQKEKFFKQIIAGGMTENVANELWTQIETFAGYGFNKAHAASYGLVAYQTAYLKSNFPPEYMSALMTSNKDDLDKLAIEINECNRMGIKVLPPSVNESFVDFGVVKDTGNVRFGLSAVKNVGMAVAEEIIKDRKKNGVYKDLNDLISRLGSKVINKKSLESLVMAGALDDLGERAELLFNMERILSFATDLQKTVNKNQGSLFGDAIEVSVAKLELNKTAPATKRQRLSWERELLGIYISDHPLSDLKAPIESSRTIAINQIRPSMENEFVRVSGIVTTVLKKLTRSNQNMAFIKIEDLESNIELLIFPKVLEANKDFIVADTIIAADGFVSYKDGAAKILVENIYEIKEKTKLPTFERRDKKRQWNNSPKQETHSFSSQPEVNLAPPKVIIVLPKNSDRSILLHLKQIMNEHPGESPVTLKIPANDNSFTEKKIGNKVALSPILVHRVEELVGQGQIY